MGHARIRGGAPIAAQVGNPPKQAGRLFVALPLPAEVTRALARLTPRAAADVRLVPEADMHVTLHFLGSSGIEAVARALEAVDAVAFEVELTETGHFALKGRKKILWLGVATSAPLLALHAAVADALALLGFEPETRPFKPHVTVARLGPKAPREVVREFEQGALPAGASRFACSRFALYSSRTEAEGARYAELRSYALSR